MSDDTKIENFSDDDILVGRDYAKRFLAIKEKDGEEAANSFAAHQEELRKAMSRLKDQMDPDNGEQLKLNMPTEEDSAGSLIGAVPDINAGTGNLGDNIEETIKSSPVDQTRLPAIKPETIRDTVNILQPKSVAFGQYLLTEWQEDIMTLIMEQLQDYMSTSLSAIRPDVFGELRIRIDCSNIANNKKSEIIAQIDKMMHYQFKFWWHTQNSTQKVQTKGFIISTLHNYVGTSYADLVINKWAIPFLLYYGKGIGGNYFDKRKALEITGKYGKRLYKTLSGYVDRGVFDYKIESFRKDYCIPDSYTNGTLKKHIIEMAVNAINDVHPGFFISFEFLTLDEDRDTEKKNKRRRTFDTIRFTMTKTGPDLSGDNFSDTSDSEKEARIVIILGPMLEDAYRNQLHNYIKIWRNHGDLNFVFSKVDYYASLLAKGAITPGKMRNFLFKAIEEETGIKLRTTRKKTVKKDPETSY